MIEVEIHQIRVGRDGSPERCLILRAKDPEDQRICPIMIGWNEAAAIVAPSQDPPPPRPMTHDLLINAIDELGGKIRSVYVRGLQKSTFFADINIDIDDEMITLDARPSDSIALAVRARVPIYIDEEVLERVNRDLQPAEESEEGGKRGRQSEEAASPVTPEQRKRLSAFSEFMETLSMDQGGEDASK